MVDYNAFISYSHDDSAIAERISRRLRRYKAPKSTGLHKKQLKIFRDVERLTADPDLSDALTERLKVSDRFILLCSPSAATSEYVVEEVSTFLKLKSYDDILYVLCRGTFEDSIPSVLKREEEPLFIDLSNAGNKQFRDETLRLIAALHGVDYANLYREDDKLKRRRRSVISLSLIFMLFLIFSGYLITTTQPETWQKIPQPFIVQDLMPIHEFAVNQEDPNTLLYEGHDAKWGTNPRPEGYTMYPEEYLPDGGPDFKRYLEEFKTDPLLRIRFRIEEMQSRGEMDVYGILGSSENKVNYLRSLRFTGMTRDSIQQQILIPPSVESLTDDPYNLSPWPLDTLKRAGLFRDWYSIEGTLINLLTGQEIETEFVQEEFAEGYDEWVAIWDPAYRIFSNKDAESLVVLGDTLAYIENEEDVWDSIVKSKEWKTYTKPINKGLGSVFEGSPEAITKIADSIPDTVHRDSLIAKLTSLSKAAEITSFSLISSDSSLKNATLIEVKGFIDSPENVDGIPLQWLFRVNASSHWYPVILPVSETGTSIIDIIPINSKEVFIVTDTHGYFLTEDAGRSWQQANYGESNLGNGRILKTIVAGNPAQVYCLVDRNNSFNEGENALYRFVRRNWAERWRAGLVNVLE